MFDYKRLEEELLDASEILKRKAKEISEEVMEENVSGIYITIRCTPGEIAIMDIERSYVCG